MYCERNFLSSRSLVLSLGLGLAALGLAGPALAQVNLGGIVTATDYNRISEIAAAYGPVEDRSDSNGRWIRGEIDGTTYSIAFLNCGDSGQDCSSVQFRAWWRSEGAHTIEAMNQWNRDRRFSAAYLDGDNNATIEFDVNLEGGVTAVNFDDTMQWWRLVLRQFKEMVIDAGATAAPPSVPGK